MGECGKSKKRTQCLKNISIDFLNKFSLKEVFSVFEKNETKPELISICHEEAHYLGRQEYQKQKSLSKVFSSCNHSCLGGCYHGAVEGYFIEKNIAIDGENDEAVAKEISSLCGKKSDYQTPQDLTECLHGLGHAVMFLTENELPRSLKLCDTLNTEGEQELCYTGALMANTDSVQSQDHPTNYIKADDPMYPCPILDKKYQKICYTYGVLQGFQSELDKTISICKQVPSEYAIECFQTMGRDRVYSTSDEKVMKSECDLISESQFREACYIGTVGSLVVRYGLESEKPLSYCSILDSTYKDSCYRELAFRLKNWTSDKDKLLSVCKKMPAEYTTACQITFK